jgi:hypothetical protein
MFYFFSQVKVKRVLFTGLVLVLFAGFLGGCSVDPKTEENTTGLPDGLLGKWVSDNFGDYWEITGSGTIINGYGNDVYSSGIIRNVTNFNSSSGVMIVEFSSSYSFNPARPFGAVYYLNFTGNTVSPNSAWDSTDPNGAEVPTLAEAITKFTQTSMSNYVNTALAVPYTKQK